MRVRVRVPASTANLGPGFDALGCALSLFLDVDATFTASDAHRPTRYVVAYEGESAEDVPLDHRHNLILQSALHLHQRLHTHNNQLATDPDGWPNAGTLTLRISNAIPLSRGLGSSAAAIVAGVMLANALTGAALDKHQLMRYVLELEPHPDNVSACLFGRMTASMTTTSGKGHETVVLSPNPSIRFVCVVPDQKLSTEKARQVLPTEYARSDVVYNVQRVGVLVAALTCATSVDARIVHEALQDRVHVPYRSALVPGLGRAMAEMRPDTHDGLLGITLSGAGPTIVALVRANAVAIGACIQSKLLPGVTSRVLILDVCEEGAVVQHQQQ